MNLPKQVTLTQYLHMSHGIDGTPRFDLYSCDISANSSFGDCACLGLVTVVVDVPQVDPVAKMIDSLEQQVERERADSQMRVNALLDRISKLQCLEYKPEDSA